MAVRALRTTRADRIVYRRIVVPLGDDDESELGVALAAELAPEGGGAAITAVVVVEIPAELPLEAHMHDEEGLAKRALEKASAIAASRGVPLRTRVVRARARGEAIVAEADAARADLIVLRAPRHPGTALFGRTADYVLRHASCRVLVLRP
ncbi:MAG TPA: universal stress protein [Gaiellaceae bacterium]|nr:universal stress protein [Gaiellaceae bacterium]